MKTRTLARALWCLLPLAGGCLAAGDDSAIGRDTANWLELQREGQQMGGVQRLSGAVESNVYQRYLESFSYPIPDVFDQRDEYLSSSDTQ